LKKEAMVIPTPPAAAAPASPGAPKMPGAPASPPLHVADLGKSMIEGHEVEGKRFTFTPPQAPAPAGEQTTYCKPTSTEEPHPSVFEIPPGYTLKKP
jgi:hypothetical protein